MPFFAIQVTITANGDLLKRLTDLRVLPYCGQLSRPGGSFKGVRFEAIQEYLMDKENLKECQYMLFETQGEY